jgi:hypothetical protein
MPDKLTTSDDLAVAYNSVLKVTVSGFMAAGMINYDVISASQARHWVEVAKQVNRTTKSRYNVFAGSRIATQ